MSTALRPMFMLRANKSSGVRASRVSHPSCLKALTCGCKTGFNYSRHCTHRGLGLGKGSTFDAGSATGTATATGTWHQGDGSSIRVTSKQKEPKNRHPPDATTHKLGHPPHTSHPVYGLVLTTGRHAGVQGLSQFSMSLLTRACEKACKHASPIQRQGHITIFVITGTEKLQRNTANYGENYMELCLVHATKRCHSSEAHLFCNATQCAIQWSPAVLFWLACLFFGGVNFSAW